MQALATALAAPLSPDARVVEVGVGERPVVAARLTAAGYDVVATDVSDRSVPDGVDFRRDDVTDPDEQVYEGAELVYALRCPPELQDSLRGVARSVGAAAAFTTLGGDPATVPVDRETVQSGALYWTPTDG